MGKYRLTPFYLYTLPTTSDLANFYWPNKNNNNKKNSIYISTPYLFPFPFLSFVCSPYLFFFPLSPLWWAIVVVLYNRHVPFSPPHSNLRPIKASSANEEPLSLLPLSQNSLIFRFWGRGGERGVSNLKRQWWWKYEMTTENGGEDDELRTVRAKVWSPPRTEEGWWRWSRGDDDGWERMERRHTTMTTGGEKCGRVRWQWWWCMAVTEGGGGGCRWGEKEEREGEVMSDEGWIAREKRPHVELVCRGQRVYVTRRCQCIIALKHWLN